MNHSERRFFLKRFFSFNASTISTESAASVDEPTLTTTSTSTGQAQSSKANTISSDFDETSRSDEKPAETLTSQESKMADLLKVETVNESSKQGPALDLLGTHLLTSQIHQQLQHQQSIELKPFRKKEVLIDESLNQEAVVIDELSKEILPNSDGVTKVDAENLLPSKSENQTGQAGDSKDGQAVLACSLVRKPTVIVGPSPAITPFIPLKYRFVLVGLLKAFLSGFFILKSELGDFLTFFTIFQKFGEMRSSGLAVGPWHVGHLWISNT